MSHVAATGQQPFNGNVLDDGFPVPAIAANSARGSLLWCGVQQTREPGQRHAGCVRPSTSSTYMVKSSKRTSLAEVCSFKPSRFRCPGSTSLFAGARSCMNIASYRSISHTSAISRSPIRRTGHRVEVNQHRDGSERLAILLVVFDAILGHGSRPGKCY